MWKRHIRKIMWIYIDELDFMSEYCFEVISAIAIERPEIGITVSSTPLGKRSHFYKMCTDRNLGYSEHYHPSTHNPSWGPEMEASLRASLTAEGYVHEVLAEFGTQERGVFPKDKLDEARTFEDYAYNELTYGQKIECERTGKVPVMYNHSIDNKPPATPFRTVGVDWDKFGAASSIIVLEYDVIMSKFKVIKRIEVPRSDYTYDNAVKKIVEVNEIYNPAYIYCDAGSGEYQIERLHIIGEERPHTGLKHKVKRWQFSQTLDVIDPITLETVKEPLKPFMVNQLTLAFERSNMILSPYDDVLHKQLIDYEVEKINDNGKPTYTSKDEHYIDALGLAYLAFVLEFKELTKTVKDASTKNMMGFSSSSIAKKGVARTLSSIQQAYASSSKKAKDSDDLPGDRQTWFKSGTAPVRRSASEGSWGSRAPRGGMRGFQRRMW